MSSEANDQNVSGESGSLKFDSLSFELALSSAKLYASLLPSSHIPLPWLKELATQDWPRLADDPRLWILIVRVLDREVKLFGVGDVAEVACANERVASELRNLMDDFEAPARRNRLRAFYLSKLEAHRSDASTRKNRVMTGDPNKEVTAWTVPAVEVVRARAADDDRVEIVEFGDGTYSVRVKVVPMWEEECLKAYVAHEFASDDLDGIAWALRTHLISVAELETKEEWVCDALRQNPEGRQEAMVAGLFWLTLAHKSYGEGWSCRTSWHLAAKAVEILQRLRDRRPDDGEVASFLTEAEKAYWSYDD